MQHLSWTIAVPESQERNELAEDIRSIWCDALNLCASIGCGCLVKKAEVLCREANVADPYPVCVSEGPSWILTVLFIPSCVLIDFYYEGSFVGSEYQALQDALLDRGHTLTVSRQSIV